MAGEVLFKTFAVVGGKRTGTNSLTALVCEKGSSCICKGAKMTIALRFTYNRKDNMNDKVILFNIMILSIFWVRQINLWFSFPARKIFWSNSLYALAKGSEVS